MSATCLEAHDLLLAHVSFYMLSAEYLLLKLRWLPVSCITWTRLIGIEAFMAAKSDSAFLGDRPHKFEAEILQHQGEVFVINKALRTQVSLKEVCLQAVWNCFCENNLYSCDWNSGV